MAGSTCCPTLASRCWSARTAVAEGRLPSAPPTVTSTPMPWDEGFDLVDDPDDPWVPLRRAREDVAEEVQPTYVRIVPDGWSRRSGGLPTGGCGQCVASASSSTDVGLWSRDAR